MLAFLLKENEQVDEAETLVGKVKEKKMAELFADMEKMDIQAERKKTAEQRERADKAELLVEKGIQLFVETCKEVGIPRAAAIERLIEKYSVSYQEAEAWLDKYWETDKECRDTL